MTKKIKVTIIILDYLKASQIVENVHYLQKQQTNFDFKIIVIDNSADKKNKTLLKKIGNYEKVQLIFNKKNIGYTKAHNAVSKYIEGEYILILNPDISLKNEQSLQMMVNFMKQHKKVGIIGPKQVNPDGSVAKTIRAFPKFHLQISRRTFLRKIPFLRQKVEYDEMQHLDYSNTQAVDWVQSSCIFLRKSLWDQIEGFSLDYFLFMGDVELCFQTWKKGCEVVYTPQIQVFADGKRCSEGGFNTFFKSWVLRQHVKDALKYQMKHLGEKNPKELFLENNKSSVESVSFRTNMKGIILSGGSGSRLAPLTHVTSKQLLPVYNKPMIYYSIEKLIKAGIKEILIIVAPENAGDFLNLLGSGKKFDAKFTYEIQEKPAGIAQAFLIGENFIGKDNVTLVLGDNIFEDDFSSAINSFESGAKIFAKKEKQVSRFGVVEFNKNNKVLSIEEKPEKPKSNYAQTGIYVCDNTVIKKVKNLKPSKRGELEITDVMQLYLKENALEVDFISGKWFDCGTHESLFEASQYIRKKSHSKD